MICKANEVDATGASLDEVCGQWSVCMCANQDSGWLLNFTYAYPLQALQHQFHPRLWLRRHPDRLVARSHLLMVLVRGPRRLLCCTLQD